MALSTSAVILPSITAKCEKILRHCVMNHESLIAHYSLTVVAPLNKLLFLKAINTYSSQEYII